MPQDTELQADDEDYENLKKSAKTDFQHKSLRDRLSLDVEQQQSVFLFIMQTCFLSMALSLLVTGFSIICVAGGMRTRMIIDVIVYTSYASLGAIGGISLMVLLLNFVSGVDTS